MVVEVMGRDAGWIALYSGIAGGADAILIENGRSMWTRSPNRFANGMSADATSRSLSSPKARSSAPAQVLRLCRTWAKTNLVTPSSEKSIANILAREIEQRTGFETRAVVLGHIQRGGSPTAFDRVRQLDMVWARLTWFIAQNSAAWQPCARKEDRLHHFEGSDLEEPCRRR